MKIKKIPGENLKVSQWEGGKTTEIDIYPTDSSYKDRNFKYRISTATIEIGRSRFTSLPSVRRLLLVLSGVIKLKHKGQHEVELSPFAKDTFDGGWETESSGKGSDFNLMLREGTSGDLEKMSVRPNEFVKISVQYKETKGIYILKGKVKINYYYDQVSAKEGDYIKLFSDESDEYATLTSDKGADYIMVTVNLQ